MMYSSATDSSSNMMNPFMIMMLLDKMDTSPIFKLASILFLPLLMTLITANIHRIISSIKSVWGLITGSKETQDFSIVYTAITLFERFSTSLNSADDDISIQFKAWMKKIKEMTEKREKEGSNEDGITSVSMANIFSLKESDDTALPLPSQEEEFLIDGVIYGRVVRSEVILSGETDTVKAHPPPIYSRRSKGGWYNLPPSSANKPPPKGLKIELAIFVKDIKDKKFLLDYERNLIDNYKNTACCYLNQRSYIFELQAPKVDQDKNTTISWTKDKFDTKRSLKSVWFDGKDAFVEKYQRFVHGEKEYNRREDPWNFSILLHGPSGCGKTSIVKAIANESRCLDDPSKPVHVFLVSFEHIWNAEVLRKIFFEETINIDGDIYSDLRIPITQRIYVFDEFESALFAKRDLTNLSSIPPQPVMTNESPFGGYGGGSSYSTKTSGYGGYARRGNQGDDMISNFTAQKFIDRTVTLADVLVMLDGVRERRGMRCFWMTNYDITTFDESFLRPGRQDAIIKLGLASKQSVQNIIENYYQELIDNDEDEQKIPHLTLTPSQIKQICMNSSCLRDCINRISLDRISINRNSLEKI